MFFGPFSPIPELYLFCEYFPLRTYPVETTDIQTHSDTLLRRRRPGTLLHIHAFGKQRSDVKGA